MDNPFDTYVPYGGQGSPTIVEATPFAQLNSEDVIVSIPPVASVGPQPEFNYPTIDPMMGQPGQQPGRQVVEVSTIQVTQKKTCSKGGSGICLPFIVYVVLSVIILLGFIFSRRSINETLIYCFLMLLWIFVVGFFIWWLCRNGEIFWAWIVLLLPLIIQITWVTIAWIF